jgi:hypothetical protein
VQVEEGLLKIRRLNNLSRQSPEPEPEPPEKQRPVIQFIYHEAAAADKTENPNPASPSHVLSKL